MFVLHLVEEKETERMTFPKRAFVAALTLAAVSITLPVLLAASGEKVKQVSSQFVCMINKKHFDKEQTPVSVDGRTYYACCDMCIKQLQENPESRKDVDPVSGTTVDKSSAAIGIDKDGNVYFFENVDNLKKFRVPEKRAKAATP